MSRSKKLVREFKGTLTGALAGFIYRALKGDRAGASKIKNAAVKLDPSVQKHFDDLQKHVQKQMKDTERTISKMSPEDQKDLARMAKKWESKNLK
tara:strand:+ start:59 stop:343 length:285 start_codon:yes stop_codon:yes gene_type:complete